MNKLKLDLHKCSSQDITIVLCLVMTLVLISFFCFFSSLSMWLLVFHLEYHCIVLWLIRLTNCLKMGCSRCPKRHYIENTWISRKVVLFYPSWYFKWFNTDSDFYAQQFFCEKLCSMIVWFWQQIVSSSLCCYKFNISMFSNIFQSFSKNWIIHWKHRLKKFFSTSFFAFFLSLVFKSIYGFSHVF